MFRLGVRCRITFWTIWEYFRGRGDARFSSVNGDIQMLRMICLKKLVMLVSWSAWHLFAEEHYVIHHGRDFVRSRCGMTSTLLWAPEWAECLCLASMLRSSAKGDGGACMPWAWLHPVAWHHCGLSSWSKASMSCCTMAKEMQDNATSSLIPNTNMNTNVCPPEVHDCLNLQVNLRAHCVMIMIFSW